MQLFCINRKMKTAMPLNFKRKKNKIFTKNQKYEVKTQTKMYHYSYRKSFSWERHPVIALKANNYISLHHFSRKSKLDY